MPTNSVFQVFILNVILTLTSRTASLSFVRNRINYKSYDSISILPNGPWRPPYGNGQQDLESIRTEERIASLGYPVEMHEVTTADGYILTMHHIPHGRNSTSTPRRKPVLFQHGGLGDSFSWFFNHPDKIIPFQLADLDYPIWIANLRGTSYSRRHKHLTDRDKKFFDFSMDEIAKYDIPAQIDYILNITGEPKLHVVAISLGPQVVHMMLSTYPDYNEKISLVTSLDPVVYETIPIPVLKLLDVHIPSTLQKTILDLLSDETGEFPAPWIANLIRTWTGNAIQACQNPTFGFVCEKLPYVFHRAKIHPEKLKILPLVFSHILAPLSARLADHFIQCVRTERFQKYDFGEEVNSKVYGIAQPPLYHLKDTSAPVAVFYVESDSSVVPASVYNFFKAFRVRMTTRLRIRGGPTCMGMGAIGGLAFAIGLALSTYPGI